MSDALEIRIAPGTVQELTTLLSKMDQFAEAAGKMVGSGKALEELRKLMVGVGKSGSAFSELRASLDSLKSGLTTSVGQMVATMQSLPTQMATAMRGMSATGEAAGKALGEGVASGASKSLTAAQGTVRAAVQKMQREYEAMSANPNATIKLPALASLAASGVQLFPSDRDRLDTYKKTQQTFDSMYSYGVQTSKKAASESSAFQLKVANETQQSLNAIYRNGVQERKRLDAEAAAAVTARASRQVGLATREATGQYTNLSTLKTIDPAAVRAGTAALQKQSAAMHQFQVDANDLHSAARGLASGFGLLWLTWGNMIPLLAGAAISNGVVQTIKAGAEVEHTMALIGAMSEETTASMVKLNAAMLDLARNGPFGPKEVSEAMKVLSQAGLNAEEVMRALKPSLDFSVAGDISITRAADTLVSATTAFNMGAAGFSAASDIISKTAAVSKTSVENMAGAFKTASVLNAQYGVSLVDVGVGLATVANLGIEGSAAGTALRNMYADLGGRTKEVSKLMKEHGIVLRELSTGKFPDIITVIKQLDVEFKKLNPIAAQDFLKALSSERGSKPLVEMLELLRQMPKEAQDGIGNRLEEIRARIKDSYAFAASVAIEANLTTTNRFKSLMAGFQADMVEGFKEVAPALNVTMATIKDALAGGGFKDAIVYITTTVATFTQILVEHGSVFLTIGGLWLAARTSLTLLAAALAVVPAVTGAASAIMGVFSIQTAAAATAATSLAVAEGAAATGATALATGVSAAGASAGGISALAAAFNPVIAALALIAAGFAAWYYWKNRVAGDTAIKAGANDYASTVDQLQKERERLDKETQLLKQGFTQSGAAAHLAAEDKFQKGALGAAQERLQIQKEIADSERMISRYRPGGDLFKNFGAAGSTVREAEEQANLTKLMTRLTDARRKETENLRELRTETDAVTKSAKENADAVAAQAKRSTLGTPGGADLANSKKGPKGGGTVHYEDLTKDLLKADTELYTKQMANLKASVSEEQKILDAQYAAKITSAGNYEARTIQLQAASEAERLARIADYSQKAQAKLTAVSDTLTAQAGGKDNLEEMLQKHGDAYEKLSPAMRNVVEQYKKLQREQETLTTTTDEASKAVHRETDARTRLAAIKQQGQIAAEANAYALLGAEISGAAAKLGAKLAMEEQALSLSERDRAGAAAAADLEGQYAKSLEERSRVLALMVEGQKALSDAMSDVERGAVDQASVMAELQARYDIGDAAVNRFRDTLANLKQDLVDNKNTASAAAIQLYDHKQVIKMRDDIADALVQGVMKGRDAAKSIWVTLRDWLKNLFANTVLKPVFQTVVGNTMNSLLGNAAGSAASSSLGGMFGSAAGSATGGSGLLGSIGTAVSSAMMPAVDAIATAVGYTGGVSAAGGTLAQFSAGAEMMSSLAAAAPYVAAAIAVAYALSTKSTPHTGGYALADSSGNVTDITQQQQGNQDAGVQKAMADLAKTSASLLNAFSTKFGGTGNFSVRSVLESDGKDGSWALYHLLKDGVKQAGSFDATPQSVGGSGTLDKDPTKAAEQFSTMTASAIRTSMETLDLPGWAKKQLDALGNSVSMSDLTTAATAIYATQDAILALKTTLAPMAGSLGALATSSSDTLYNLAQLAGGFDKLGPILTSYYSNFYSSAEQHTAALANITEQYNQLNLGALPQTKEAFRGVIDSFVAGGGRAQAGGEQTYLTLMQLANGFAALDSGAVDLTKQLDLQIAVLRAQGKESAAVAMEREREITALAKTNPELVDLQKSLYAAADAASLAAAQNSLNAQLARALGNESAALAIERGVELETLRNTHPELLTLQQRLYDLADAATAAAAAASLFQAASAAQDKFLTDPQKADKGYHTVAQSLIKVGNSSSESELVKLLQGLTKQQIYDLASSFITMSSASIETKIAVAEAAGALADLKDAAAQAAYDLAKTSLEGKIKDMTDKYGDLQAAMDLIIPPTKTISQQYIDNADAIKTLTKSLDDLLGLTKKTPQEILGDMLTAQKSLKDARTGVKDAIFGSKLAGMTPKDRAAALREQEAGLYAQLRTSADPASVVSKLQSVILDRVKAEAAIQESTASIVVSAAEQQAALAKVTRDAQLDSLKSQLDGFKKLKDLAANMGQFISELKFGDLSSHNFADQLNSAKGLFYTTLDKARNGDANAVSNVQGNAQAYLKEAQTYYGGATAPYNAIFEGVLASLQQLGLDGQAVDPQIAALTAQIDKLTAINSALDALSATTTNTSAAEVAALQTLDDAIAARQEADAIAIAAQTKLAQDQLDALIKQQATLELQIAQQSKIYTDLIASLDKLNSNFEKAQKNANMEAAKP